MYTASIYMAVKGWTGVIYGKEGPEDTTWFGYRYPWQAYEAVKPLAKAYNAKLNKLTFSFCHLCFNWTINGRCEHCDHVDFVRKAIDMEKAHGKDISWLYKYA